MRFARAFPSSTIKPRSGSVRTCDFLAAAAEGAPLERRTLPKATEILHSDSTRRLTFDMSGRLGPAQLAQGCPLDGGVRAQRDFCPCELTPWQTTPGPGGPWPAEP